MDDTESRKRTEKELIQSKKPISQSGIGNRMKNIDEKMRALTEFLNQ